MFFLRQITLFLFALLLGVNFFIGCAGYQLGPTGTQVSGEQSIEITRFKNLTIEPRLSEYLMIPLRRAVQQDGTFRLCTEAGSADYVLEGVITEFNRDGVGSIPTDVIAHVDEYITIRVDITIREQATGKIILTQGFSSSTIFPMGADQTSSERQNIPIAMEGLAQNIVSILADGKIKD